MIKDPRARDQEEIHGKRFLSSGQKGTRVLLFIQSLELGGSETQCVEVARHLAREGYSVTVGCLWKDGPLERKLVEAGVRCVVFPVPGTLLRPNAIRQMFNLTAFIRTE